LSGVTKSEPGRPAKFAAIDVGTNAVRLKIVRVAGDGSLHTIEQVRDAIRPGEGVFETGRMPPHVQERLVATMRRYMVLARRHDARVRAVATSSLRDARNAREVLTRVEQEAGLHLEVISGLEEARLVCLGVLSGAAPNRRTFVLDIGGGSTEVALATGEHPDELWSLGLGTVRLTEIFPADGKVTGKQLKLMRRYARDVTQESIRREVRGAARIGLGSSGTTKMLCAHAGDGRGRRIPAEQISSVVESVAKMEVEERVRRFGAQRADVIVAGAVVLEAVASYLDVEAIEAVEAGLRDGLVLDLVRRSRFGAEEMPARESALALGRRFGLDETHALHAARLALSLYDQLEPVHDTSASGRVILEVAALLHDIGYAINPHRHHRHSQYIVEHAGLAGLTERETNLAARVARYHRATPPQKGHSGLSGLLEDDATLVCRLATILRLADAFDRSRHQPVEGVVVEVEPKTVRIVLRAPVPLDLEIWDAQHESELFERVFGRRLDLVAVGSDQAAPVTG
jgi:exopolyphosphatase/guanosine-5'-triphosphate,3'-diphosphate pyrophosphatase